MKRLFVLILMCLLPLSLAWAEPFLSIQGPIMERMEARGIIVVNETRFFVEPTTTITDHRGRGLKFRYLTRGRWVSIEAAPDDDGAMVAERIVVIRRR